MEPGICGSYRLIDRYLKNCDEISLKVLLLLLRRGESVETQQLCDELGAPPEQVDQALRFWANENVILLNQQPVKVRVQKQETPVQKASLKTAKDIGSTPARPSKEDMQRYLTENKEIKFLIQECERLFARPLNFAETQTLVGLYTWAGMHPDIILMLVQYCKSLGKTSLRYVEKTALDWLDKGIDTHEKAESHIKKRTRINQNEGLVRAALGI